MQSTNTAKVRTTIVRMQTYNRAYDAKILMKDRCRKCTSVNGRYFDSESDANNVLIDKNKRDNKGQAISM